LRGHCGSRMRDGHRERSYDFGLREALGLLACSRHVARRVRLYRVGGHSADLHRDVLPDEPSWGVRGWAHLLAASQKADLITAMIVYLVLICRPADKGHIWPAVYLTRELAENAFGRVSAVVEVSIAYWT
jgi:hypothetical protein